MSTPALIQAINDSEADFLVVALGAKKGHEWIARNLDSLRTPVISHLGASINFLAGTIRRAPGWVQSIGMEWAWRILQEPALARRYWEDGSFFLPAALAAKRQPGNPSADAAGQALEIRRTEDGLTWALSGELTRETADTLQLEMNTAMARSELPDELDLSGLTLLD